MVRTVGASGQAGSAGERQADSPARAASSYGGQTVAGAALDAPIRCEQRHLDPRPIDGLRGCRRQGGKEAIDLQRAGDRRREVEDGRQAVAFARALDETIGDGARRPHPGRDQ